MRNLSELIGRPKRSNLDDEILSPFASESSLPPGNSFKIIFVSLFEDIKQLCRVGPVTYHEERLPNNDSKLKKTISVHLHRLLRNRQLTPGVKKF